MKYEVKLYKINIQQFNSILRFNYLYQEFTFDLVLQLHEYCKQCYELTIKKFFSKILSLYPNTVEIF